MQAYQACIASTCIVTGPLQTPAKCSTSPHADGARDGQRALESMRAAWHDAETAHQARQQWPAEVAAQLDAALAAVVQVSNPTLRCRRVLEHCCPLPVPDR